MASNFQTKSSNFTTAAQRMKFLQAGINLQNGIMSHEVMAPAKDTPPRHDGLNIPKKEFKKELTMEKLRSGVTWKSAEGDKRRPLPITAPQAPEEWDTTVWEQCVVFGKDNFHMFIVPQSRPKPLRQIPGIGRLLPMQGLEFVMRVSESLDTRNHSSHYQRHIRQPEVRYARRRTNLR